MERSQFKIGFIRRGFSLHGGAESYLKRLAEGVCAAGHEARLWTTPDWPEREWPYGSVIRLPGKSATTFADEIGRLPPGLECDVVMSLERIWKCDVYRAGDGVHRAWLERRSRLASRLQKMGYALNRKHAATLRLEHALFAEGGAGRVLANSHMVKDEIVAVYGYPPARIDVVYNGVPAAFFRPAPGVRAQSRQTLQLAADDLAVLFVGSGWERKGLRFAIEAVESCGDSRLRLIVAGRGNQSNYRSPVVKFSGVVHDVPSLYAAADIFLLPTIYDPFSNACLEAAAAGLPVITTRGNGFSEIIEEGIHGSVVDDPDDVGRLRVALEFWSEENRRQEAQLPLFEVAARFDISVNVARTLEILLTQPRPRPRL